MLPYRRKPGRPPKAPSERRRGLNASLPPSLIEGVEIIALERGVKVSRVVEEFIERGVIEHEVRKLRERQEAIPA